MAELKEQGLSSSGKITCDRNILLSIINLATKEINGVARLSNSFIPWYKKAFVSNNYEGVNLKIDGAGKLFIDVYIDVFAGVSIPEIAYRVQENVKNAIRSMVDMKTTKVNVHILNVEVGTEVPSIQN